MQNGHSAFLAPLSRGLQATSAVHLRLIGKPVVDFLLLIIVLFFTRCYGWHTTSEYRLKMGVSEVTRSVWFKISGRRGRPHQPFSCQKTTCRWPFIWYKNFGRSFFPFIRIHAFDKWTDGRTKMRSLILLCMAVEIFSRILGWPRHRWATPGCATAV